MTDPHSIGYGRPARGSLSNYGKRPNELNFTADDPHKRSGDGTEGAPQVYVRLMVEFSYDRPDVESRDVYEALRREAGAAIRREVEKALTGDLLAAKLGDARLTLRSLIMRQEDTVEAFGQPVSVTVAPAEQGLVSVVQVGPEYQVGNDGVIHRRKDRSVSNPTHEQARPKFDTFTVDEVRRLAAESLERGETKEQFLLGLQTLASEVYPNPDDPAEVVSRHELGQGAGQPESRSDIRGPLMGDGSEVRDPYDSNKGGVSDAEDWDEDDVPPNAGSAS